MFTSLCFLSILFPAVVYTTFRRQLPTTPDGCFYELNGRRVNCVQPFLVQTGLTEQQCLDLCQQTSNCQSVQYTLATQRCELFNMGGPSGFGRRSRGRGGSFGGRGNGQFVGGGGRRGYGGRRGSSSGNFGRGGRRSSRGGRRYRRKASMGGMRGMGSMGSSGSSEVQRHGRRRGGGRRRTGGNFGRRGGFGNCGYGPQLVPSRGTNYYRWTNNCRRGGTGIATTPRRRPITTTGRPLPAGAECRQGDVPRYLKLEGVQLNGNDDFTFTANGEQECIDACTRNELPDGTQAPCLSFDYNSASRRCSITTERIPPNGNGQTTETPGTSYYEKVCLDGNLVTNCPEILQQFPQKILVGFARHVSTVSSYSQCIQDCLDAQAQFGFTCRSGMFYYEENELNCILNSEDRGTQPDLFTGETQDVVTYFETGCFNSRVAADMAADIMVADPKKSVVTKGAKKWSPWSTCDKSEDQRRRFRKCKSMNPNNCETEVGPCD